MPAASHPSRPQRLALVALCLLVSLVGASVAQADAVPTVSQAPLATNTFPDGQPRPSAVPLDGRSVSVDSSAVASLRTGETLNVAVEAEVTNDVIVAGSGDTHHWIDAPVNSEIVLASSPEATSGTVLAAPAGGMITWREHHASIVRDASFVVPAALQGQSLYVNLVVSGAMSPLPSQCFDYNRQSAAFTPALAGCALHVENDRGLVDLSVLRLPAAADGGFTAQSIGQGTMSDANLPIPGDSSQPGYGKLQVVWSSGPFTSLHSGDTLDTSVQLDASIAQLVAGLPVPGAETTGCNVMLSGKLYLSPYPDRLPAPGDPLGNAVPGLDTGYAFNLTQAAPQAVATWHAHWTADGAYAGGNLPGRYVVLATWASGSAACPGAMGTAGAVANSGLRILASGSGGDTTQYTPSGSADAARYATSGSVAGNGAAQLPSGGSPRVVAVLPVQLQAGDLLRASGETALRNAGQATAGTQIVAGTSYTGPDDTSGTSLTQPASASLTSGSDRSLLHVSGEMPSGSAQTIYLKLLASGASADGSSVTVDQQASALRAVLMRQGSAPTAADFPAPPSAPSATTKTPAVSSTPAASPAPVATPAANAAVAPASSGASTVRATGTVTTAARPSTTAVAGSSLKASAAKAGAAAATSAGRAITHQPASAKRKTAPRASAAAARARRKSRPRHHRKARQGTRRR